MSTGATSSVFDGVSPISSGVELLFVQVALIIAFTRLVALPLRLLRQPTVLAEVIGGILLGPSVMGQIPNFTNTIFPATSVSTTLTGVGNIGLVLFLFAVGCELDLSLVKNLGPRPIAMSVGSIILPMGLGFAVSVPLWNYMMNGQGVTSFGVFAFFIAVAMSISALPVLARLNNELGLSRTPVGVSALSAAVLDDMVAWSLLAVVVALATSTNNPVNAVYTLLCTAGFVLVIFGALRPLLPRVLDLYVSYKKLDVCEQDPKTATPMPAALTNECNTSAVVSAPPAAKTETFTLHNIPSDIPTIIPCPTTTDTTLTKLHTGVTLTTTGACVILLFLCAWVTTFIGVDSIFGAFWCGLAMPRHRKFSLALAESMRDIITVVFLPIYFTLSGLNTNFTLLNTWTAWGLILLVTVAACVGKGVGGAGCAYLSGLRARESIAVGVLLNTKGLVELIVLNVGLSTKTLNDETFAAMVMMAIITTTLTSPLVMFVYPKKYHIRSCLKVNRESVSSDVEGGAC